MKLNLPYPANWSDFQDLCFSAFGKKCGEIHMLIIMVVTDKPKMV